MEIQAVNENDVELVVTSRGNSKFLVSNKPSEGGSVMIRNWDAETNIPVHSHPFNEMFYTPLSSAVLIITSASSSVMVMGFSISTCFLFSSAMRACSECHRLGVAM